MEKHLNEKLYTIGEVSKIVQMPASALRYYDELNVLKPEGRNDGNGYRYYTEKQIMKCMMISEMRRLGVPCADIKKLFEQRNLTAQRNSLIKRLQSLRDEMEHLWFKYDYIEELIKDIDRGQGYLKAAKVGKSGRNSIEVRYIPETYAVSIPVHGCFYEQVRFSKSQKRLYDICEKNHLRICGSAISLFHNPGLEHFSMENYTSKWILPVKAPREKITEILLFPEHWCLCAPHIGPYKNIAEKYQLLLSYAEEHHIEIIGNPMEEYMISCANICGSENYITNVMFPIRNL